LGALLRFADGGGQCWARVQTESGEPIYISVARTGILVKRSRLGIFGTTIYAECTVVNLGETAHALQCELTADKTPDEMTNPVLKVFTQAALESRDAAELAARIGRARARIWSGEPGTATIEPLDRLEQRAEQLVAEGELSDSIKYFKEVIRQDPARLHVYERLMEIYAQAGRLNDATAQFHALLDYYGQKNSAADLDRLTMAAASLGIKVG
jgi:tetratricopeptide (TPR) repeat protein